MKKKIILIALLASMVFGTTACGVTQKNKNAEETATTQAVETTQEETTKEITTVEKTTVTTTVKPTTKETTVKVTETTTQAVPQEYLNALDKAETYSDVMHMSKKGIYDQLTSEYGENFPADAAQYAIDNIKADWNENALEKAKTYYKDMSMSKSAVYDQLISEYGEQFTESEAQYAIDHLD
ncbi:MAG: Ltp family lipoprotein [Ruminococcus sp.]